MALKNASETSPATQVPATLTFTTPSKNFMAKNKEGVAKLSSHISDMKDAISINSPEVTSKKDHGATPQRGKQVKKIPN